MAKKVEGYIKLQIPAGKATPVQRQNSGSGRFNHPCSNHCIRRQKLQLRYKDSACSGTDQEGLQHQVRFFHTEQG